MNQVALTSTDPWCDFGWMIVGFMIVFYVVPDLLGKPQKSLRSYYASASR